MRYRAKQKGFAEGNLIMPGEEFDFTGPKGKWMEEVGAKEKAPVLKKHTDKVFGKKEEEQKPAPSSRKHMDQGVI